MWKLKRFWHSLEACHSQVTKGWKIDLGPEYDLIQHYLRPTGELSTWYPATPPYVEEYAVVQLGKNRYDAVSEDSQEFFSVTVEEITIHELNLPQFFREVARALDLQHQVSKVSGLAFIYQIGTFNATAGYRVPVYLSMHSRQERLQNAIQRLVITHEKPFVLLLPTDDLLQASEKDILDHKGMPCLTLADSLVLDDDGTFRAYPAVGKIFEEFRQKVTDEAVSETGVVFFDSPADAGWSDLEVRFIDDDTVGVRVGQKHGIFNFAQMGMANRRNGRPTTQWDLLRAFADEYGRLTWRNRKADRRNQKRREKLTRNLQDFFRFRGDPFVYEEGGWQSRFKIVPVDGEPMWRQPP